MRHVFQGFTLFAAISLALCRVALGESEHSLLSGSIQKGATRPRDAFHRTVEVLSQLYTIDRKYKSMTGPAGNQKVWLMGEQQQPELVWITGYRAVMVGSDGATPAPQEFMCHSNLDLNPGKHRMRFGGTKNVSPRLFTLSQGQVELEFPDGFGIPVMSDEPLSLVTQVLNHNLEGTVEVRHKVTIEFVRDQDLEEPLKPLFQVGAYGLKLVEGKEGYYGVAQPSKGVHGPGCLPGDSASRERRPDSFGRVFTGHWVVKPGREVNHTLVTKLMNLPFDTTVHYIAVHLHPFAESLELRDLTADRTLFTSHAENFPDRVGLARVEAFSSPEGLPVYKDHEYELVSVYRNTTPVDQDSMAVMLLYTLDKEFKKPTSAAAKAATAQGRLVAAQ